MTANRAEASTFVAAGDQQLGLAHGDVFEKRQRSARREQSDQAGQQLLDQFAREIVQRQSGNDRVVAAIGGQLLQGHMQDAPVRGSTACQVVSLANRLRRCATN